MFTLLYTETINLNRVQSLLGLLLYSVITYKATDTTFTNVNKKHACKTIGNVLRLPNIYYSKLYTLQKCHINNTQ